MLRVFSIASACALSLLASPLPALGAAVVFSKEGDVQSALAPATPVPVAQGQRLAEGARVTTAGGSAVLRFDDGMQVAMERDTALRIVQYRYKDASAHSSDNFVELQLERGTIRVVTGWIVQVNAASFILRAPQADVTARGPADFTVALVNPMYITVQAGSVITSNAAGKLALLEGSRIAIASPNAVPFTFSSASLPSQTVTAMQNLQAVGLTTPGAAAAGALPATAGAAGGVGAGTAVLTVGAGIAGVAGALNDDEAAAATTHH